MKRSFNLTLALLLLPVMSCASNGQNGKTNKIVIGNQSFVIKDTLNSTYEREPDRDFFNYLTNTWGYNKALYANLIDGLVEVDKYGNIVLCLAESYELKINNDNTATYTFKLKPNLHWVSNPSGKKYADVVAEDFITSAKYILDNKDYSPLRSLYFDYIVGAEDYFNKKVSFDKVGVKAIDERTISFTAKEAYPYFLSLLTYEAFYPVNAKFLNEQGKDFGKSFNNLLVNGPFLATEHIANDHIKYVKNNDYFDSKCINLNTVNLKYTDKQTAPKDKREMFEKGIIDEYKFENKDTDGIKKYVGTSRKTPSDSTCFSIIGYSTASYFMSFVFNHDHTYSYDESNHVKTEDDIKNTTEALLNANFRKGFLYGINPTSYLENLGTANPEYSIARGFTPKGVVLDNKDYTSYVNDCYNKNNNVNVSLIGIDNGSDPVFNIEKAASYFATAKIELTGLGINGPIYIDCPVSPEPGEDDYVKALFKNVEEISNGLVVMNYIKGPKNLVGKIYYDINVMEGWSYDYLDPMSFLETFDYNGYNLDYLGLNYIYSNPRRNNYLPERYSPLIEGDDSSKAIDALRNDLLGNYHSKLAEANKHLSLNEQKKRFELLAEAEYELIFGSSLMIPYYCGNNYNPYLSRILPYQSSYNNSLVSSYRFKDLLVSSETLTQEQVSSLYEDYLKNK